eukprot:gene14096-15568_t
MTFSCSCAERCCVFTHHDHLQHQQAARQEGHYTMADSPQRKKRNVNTDDNLFKYGNTIEFNFDDDVTNSKANPKIVDEDDSDLFLPSPPPVIPARQFVGNGKTQKSMRQLDEALMNLKHQSVAASPLLTSPMQRKDDLIVLDSPAAREITVKVMCHGLITKYKMKQNEMFFNLQDKIAEKENTRREKIHLTLSDALIKGSDTPQSCGYSVADIIECVIIADASDKSIKIKIQTNEANSKREFKIYKSETLEKTIKTYCNDLNIKIKGLKIYFDGLNAAKRYYENQFCQPRATVVQTHPRKYPFFVSLHRCAGSSWSLDPPSTVKCVPEVEEYVNLSVYDKQQRIRVSITVTNHTKCKPECVAKKSDCSYPNVFENCQCKCPYLLKPNNIHCNPGKSWHSTKCKCSCNKVVNCPSRRRFDEESCSYDEIGRLNSSRENIIDESSDSYVYT